MTLRQLAEHHTAEESLRVQVADRQQALASLDPRIKTLRSDQAHLRSMLADRHKESSTLHHQAESAERELAVIGERLRQVQERAEENQREMAALQLEQETLAQRQRCRPAPARSGPAATGP
jgi:chromosome segregation protein